MVVMLPLDATAGSPSFTAQQTRQALSALAGPAPAGRPLGARSGVRLGTPTTTVFMNGTGSTTWNVAAHSGVLDTQTPAGAGAYYYATDGTDTGVITAANATNPRVDIVYVKVNDNVQDGSGLTSGQVLYLAGTAAPSPVAPAVPARGMVLANINVPVSGGGAPTVSWVAPTFYQSSTLVQSGVLTGLACPSLTTGNNTSFAITFPVPYSVAPVVQAFMQVYPTGVSSGFIIVRNVQGATTTGTFAVVANMGTGTSAAGTGMAISWIAVGTP